MLAANPETWPSPWPEAELTGLDVDGGVARLEIGDAHPPIQLAQIPRLGRQVPADPGNGMDDRYVSLGYQGNKIGRFDSLGLTAVYHLYQNDRTATDLGNELNVQVQAKWKRLTFMLKYASYSAQRGATPTIYRDTNKYWRRWSSPGNH